LLGKEAPLESRQRRARLTLVIGLFALAVSGCIGPPVLERQVLGYDEVTSATGQKLLLLNIARANDERPVHFTSTSSIAASFNWATTIGVTGQTQEPKGTDFLSLDIGASASENPTFSIVPITGNEFTKRILTPYSDEAFEFLVFQGGHIDRVTRLMASGIEIQHPDGSFMRFIANDPARPGEYEEFRRIVMHLRWLNNNRRLFVRPLVFAETLIQDFKGVPSPGDITGALDKGIRWLQKPDGNFEAIAVRAGRVAITNYDPMALSDRERFKLNEKIGKNPSGFVYLDIRPDGPGGNFPIQGAIKLRSMQQILTFLGDSIRTFPEFDVAPDPRTGPIEINPASTLKINVSDGEPDTRLPVVTYDGEYYTINDTHWDRLAFTQLEHLFQVALGEVEDVGIPITISK
jgi:hypothetical protein